MTDRVCVFEGDDAAPEAVRPTVSLLRELDADLEYATPPVEDHAEALAAGDLPVPIRAAIEDADTVLFGSASDEHQPIIRYLRREYGGGLPANVRPVRYLEGAPSALADPGGIDYTIVRENIEGVYAGIEGDIADLAAAAPDLAGRDDRRLGTLGEGAYALRTATRDHLESFAELACELGLERHEGEVRLTCATKSNVLPRTDGLFDEAVESAAADRDRLTHEHLHADDLGQRLVTDPKRFDVIVTPNLAGDLLSDVGAGTVGGLGIAPSGCYGADAAYFEPVHGTAPDIAGEGTINPTATILSAAMMLEYLDRDGAATRLRRALGSVYDDGDAFTPDMGGTASSEEFANAVRDRL